MATTNGQAGFSAPNVRYAALSRLSDGVAVASWTHKDANEACADTVAQVVGSGNLRSNSKLTVTVNDQIGSVHLAADGADVISVVTSQSYRREIAWKLLQELRDRVRSSVDGGSIASAFPNSLSKQLAPAFNQMCTRYNDVAAVDPLARANQQVDEVINQAKKNIDQLNVNIENLNVVEDKARQLEINAQGFKAESTQVKNKFWWKLQKMRGVVLLLALIIIGIVVIPLIVHFTS